VANFANARIDKCYNTLAGASGRRGLAEAAPNAPPSGPKKIAGRKFVPDPVAMEPGLEMGSPSATKTDLTPSFVNFSDGLPCYNLPHRAPG
jgi:hypothetical protein